MIDLRSGAWLLLATLLTTATAFVFGLFGAEVLVRIVAPQALILRRPDVWYGIDGLGWNRSPDLDTMVNFGGAGAVRLITDGEGNRVGLTGSPPDPRMRILAIGDSYVEALQVEYEETMTWLLQQDIFKNTGTRTEVECAGVGGWGPNQYLLQSKRKLDKRRYDLQLIFIFLGNDIEHERIDSLPHRQPAPYHELRIPHDLSHTEVVDALLYPLNDWLELHSHAYILFRNRLQPLLARLGLTALGIPETVLLSAAHEPWWDTTADILNDIDTNGRSHGVPTMFVLIPQEYVFANLPLAELGFNPTTMDLMQPYRIMKEKLAERGLRVVDLMPAFTIAAKDGVHCYGTVDTHFSEAGHRLAANVILPEVLSVLRHRN